MNVVSAMLLSALIARPVQESSDTKEALKKGLETSAAAGGYTFTGTVEQDSPLGGAALAIGASMLASGPDGKCTGTRGADGVSHLRIEKEKNSYEFFRKGSKVVHRQMWKGTAISPGDFASEANAALDLERLAKFASKAKDLKSETKKIDDVECLVVSASLPADFVEEEATEGGPAFAFKMFELKKIDVKFTFGKSDNLLRKAEFKFVKGFNAMIQGAMPGGDEEGGDEGGEEGANMAKASFTSAFKITLGAFSKTAAVTVPEDVKGLLTE